MEDVIFNGTSDLPSKNICEVSIKLENDENIIQYKNTPEIEIKRKLEKIKDQNIILMVKRLEQKMFKFYLLTCLLDLIHLQWLVKDVLELS